MNFGGASSARECKRMRDIPPDTKMEEEVIGGGACKRRKLSSDLSRHPSFKLSLTATDLEASLLCSNEQRRSSLFGGRSIISAGERRAMDSRSMESSSTSTTATAMTRYSSENHHRRRQPQQQQQQHQPQGVTSSSTAKTPSAAEIEEFFSAAEKYEQKRFTEKYNYDVARDVPLEGRYQWVRLKP